MDVCLLCSLDVVYKCHVWLVAHSFRGVLLGVVSYCLWFRNFKTRRPSPSLGCTATEKNVSGITIILKESAVFILGQQMAAARTFRRVNFYQTTWCCVLSDSLNFHHHENPMSHYSKTLLIWYCFIQNPAHMKQMFLHCCYWNLQSKIQESIVDAFPDQLLQGELLLQFWTTEAFEDNKIVN
jgi:hypothetical protein